jgi:hypothetical protein
MTSCSDLEHKQKAHRSYLTIWTRDLWEDAHDRADQVKESHGEDVDEDYYSSTQQ